MQAKFRLPDDLWEKFNEKTTEPAEELRKFVVDYINGKNALDDVMGVEEAAEKWDLSAGYIKNLCSRKEIMAKKIGKTWIILKSQERPNKRGN
ncbi:MULTISPECIES: helix-turn-helix domain-containing protein [Bacillus]|uniref:helix-turn-helix domain-containing protein n=1 Tax=Bacillus TaxID=1386 RepID=UPI00148327D5|nr:helix-turn-helix domain-containing protein [Bacillus sp. S0635]MCP1285238.1 helix-turn-helix domain-containing protein [Bacillus sp. S0635]